MQGRANREASLGQEPGEHLDSTHPLCIPGCHKGVLKMLSEVGIPWDTLLFI